jgi:glycosyltransferase involved in cell wall biosynthesis
LKAVRIVLLNQYYIPAEAPTAVLAADLLEALAERGHEVHAIASSRAYNDPATSYARRELIRGVLVWRTPTSGFGRRGKVSRMVDYVTFLVGCVWRLARLPRPDLVISMTTPPMLARVGLSICRRRGARLLYWAMDLYPDVAFELGVLRADGWIGRLLRASSNRVIAGADRIVALGPRMAERLTQQGARRVDVIHNWCDGRAIRPRPREDHPIRRRLGWDGKFVVLYSGNMGLAHEFETVLDAAAALADRPDILFAFVGGGARAEAIARGAAQRGLSAMEFHPWVAPAELSDGLTAGDLHLITLRDGVEGLLVPSKIYGVLAAGRPALHIGPARSAIAAILDEAACGVALTCGQAELAARTIRRYADDPALCRAQGMNARAAFEREYDRPHALRRFTELIEACAEGC